MELWVKCLNLGIVSHRKKTVCRFSGYTSTCESVNAGVPQGSVFGPLFFILYIDNSQNNTTLKVINFADDTLLYTTFKKNTYKKDNEYLNSQLKNVSRWLIDNRLRLNLNKT